MRALRVSVVAAALVLVVGCGGATTAPPATNPATRSSSPSDGPSPTPAGSTVPPVPTDPPAATGRWEPAGELGVGRATPHVVPVGEGGVLVVGNDDCGCASGWPEGPFACSLHCIRPDSRVVEAWEPTSGGWSKVGPLSAPRAELAVVALPDGRVLAVGGVQAAKGTDDERPWQPEEHHASLKRAAVIDPATGHWTQVASMGSRRTGPIAAVLRDGRVLVAGGYDLDAPTGPWTFGPGGRVVDPGEIVLAAVGSATAAPKAGLANVTPQGPSVPALATAEIYDPATDTWSRTGPMRIARHGDAAVTLADGRVLVVPDARHVDTQIGAFGWDGRPVDEHDLAGTMAEIYDPASGRWSIAGELPPPDLAAYAERRYEPSSDVTSGALVALADGGALLVGRATAVLGPSEGGGLINVGLYTRTLRFDPRTMRWSEVDRVVQLYRDEPDGRALETVVDGQVPPAAVAAPLADGRVLVAGGIRSLRGSGRETVRSRDVAIFDPRSGRWTPGPALPEPRAGGVAIALADGSVIVVGGLRARARGPSYLDDCGAGSTGLTPTVRFVPDR